MRFTLKHLLFAELSLFYIAPTFPQPIETTGKTIIYHKNDVDDARYRATQHAIKKAVLQSSSGSA